MRLDNVHVVHPYSAMNTTATCEKNLTLTSIAAKIYNALLFNRIEPSFEKGFSKNQNGFIDFSRASDSIHREMEQILQAYGLPKETVAETDAL